MLKITRNIKNRPANGRSRSFEGHLEATREGCSEQWLAAQNTLSRFDGQLVLQDGGVKATRPVARTPGQSGRALSFVTWR